MMAEVIRLENRRDIVAAREAARGIGAKIGFSRHEFRPVLMIVAELGIYAAETCGSAEMVLDGLHRSIHNRRRSGIEIVLNLPREIQPAGAPRPNSPESLGLGLPGVRRLSDEFELAVRNGKTEIHVVKWRSSAEDQ